MRIYMYAVVCSGVFYNSLCTYAAAATVGFTPPHSARTFSSERVTLTQATVITTSCVDDVLTRLHGIKYLNHLVVAASCHLFFLLWCPFL